MFPMFWSPFFIIRLFNEFDNRVNNSSIDKPGKIDKISGHQNNTGSDQNILGIRITSKPHRHNHYHTYQRDHEEEFSDVREENANIDVEFLHNDLA